MNKERLEQLKRNLRLNNISEANIEKHIALIEAAAALGWEYNEYDLIDGFLHATFSIKSQQRFVYICVRMHTTIIYSPCALMYI